MQSERLIFRYWTLEDFEFLFELWNDNRVTKYMQECHIESLEDAKQILIQNENLSSVKEGLFFLVSEKQSNIPIGNLGLWTIFVNKNGDRVEENSNLKELEIGYDFKVDTWGKGYATEAVSWLLQILPTTHFASFTKIVAYVHQENTASHKVLLKNGFVQLQNSSFTYLQEKDCLKFESIL